MPLLDAGFPDDNGVTGGEWLVRHGPTIWIDIGFDPGFDPGSEAKPEPAVTGVPALIDTGALESCIDKTLAARLGLPPVDRTTIAGVSGPQEVDVFVCQFHCPALRFTQYGTFAGVDLEGGGQVHKALIGRTFLKNAIMIYDGARGQATVAR